MRIAKVIHQSWKTLSIPYDIYRKPWIDSWQIHHPDWEHHLWTDEDNDALVRDHYPVFYESYRELAPAIKKADFARLLYMHQYGGVYVDLDFMCLRNLEPLLQNYEIVLGRLAADNGYYHIPNAFLASSRGSNFWLQVAEEIVNAPMTDRKQVETHTGPLRLERAFERYQPANSLVCANHLIYPLDWMDLLRVEKRHIAVALRKKTMSELAAEFPDSYCLTFWTHNWAQTC